jgi:hypothetical protein
MISKILIVSATTLLTLTTAYASGGRQGPHEG